MSVVRRGATIVTDLACHVVGRRHVVRAARLVLYRARLDVPNDLCTNGETLLQRWVLALAPAGGKVCVIDVGANIGRWSEAMIDATRRAGRIDDLDLHAFEPSSYTFSRLLQALGGQRVVLHRAALGDQCGASTLYVAAPGAGTNSLHRPASAMNQVPTEQVRITTLQDFVEVTRLGHIALVKIDTEGHDLAVLRGAQALLGERRISVVQFEYNHRWVYSRSFLRDAFDLLTPLGYHLGKLTPLGVEFYSGWDPDLETFVEGNYVACSPEIVGRLPSVRWWKSTPTPGRSQKGVAKRVQ
jgi:FkbM family methyltransferase